METKELIARRSIMFDVLHNKLITIQKLPEDQQQKELDTLFIQEPSIIASIDEFKKLMIVGFQRLIEDNAILKQRTAELQGQAEATNELIAELQHEVKISNERAAAAELIIEERKKRRDKVKNRVRKELNNPLQEKHYLELLNNIGHEQTFYQARARLAITILFLTGIRVDELRHLQLKTIDTLFLNQRPHVIIDTAKKGGKRSAFLTKTGKQYIKDRKNDFKFILSMQENNPDTPVFATKKGQSKVSREFITNSINSLLKELKDYPTYKFTSHSFRRGLITKLWQETGDIVFIRQVMKHAKVETTNRYITQLTVEEIADRMEDIN